MYFGCNDVVEISCTGRWRKGATHHISVRGEKERVIEEWNRRGHKCLDCDELCDEPEDEICAECSDRSREAANAQRIHG